MRPNGGGYVDRTVPLLSFVATEGLLGHLCVLPMHPTFLSKAITALSGDLPGGLARKVESESPGTVCMVLQGASGDVRPDLVDEAGEFRGGSVAEMIAVAEELSESCLRGSRAHRLHPGSLALAEELVRLELAPARRGPEGKPLSDDPPLQGEEIPTRVRVLRLGRDIGLVFLPGEPFGEIAEEIRRRSTAPRTVVAAHAGPTVGYIPTASAFETGGYEVEEAFAFYSFPGPLGKDSGERLVAAALRGISRLFG